MVRFGAMATEIPLVCSNPNANILYSTLARRPKPSRGAAVTSARTRAAISRHFIGVERAERSEIPGARIPFCD
jgi:hypothetical protein